MSSLFTYPGFSKGSNSDLEDIIALYFDDDGMFGPQDVGRLPNLRTSRTVQPSEPRLQDTVSPPEAPQQELVETDNSRAIAEIPSTEIRSSAVATDAEAQQRITPQRVTQLLGNALLANTGNASESPAELMFNHVGIKSLLTLKYPALLLRKTAYPLPVQAQCAA